MPPICSRPSSDPFYRVLFGVKLSQRSEENVAAWSSRFTAARFMQQPCLSVQHVSSGSVPLQRCVRGSKGKNNAPVYVAVVNRCQKVNRLYVYAFTRDSSIVYNARECATACAAWLSRLRHIISAGPYPGHHRGFSGGPES